MSSRYKVPPFVMKIVEEVKIFRDANPDSNRWLSSDSVVVHLQSKRGEYSRLKYAPLKRAIDQAITIVCSGETPVIDADPLKQAAATSVQMEDSEPTSNSINDHLASCYSTDQSKRSRSRSEIGKSRKQRTEQSFVSSQNSSITYADLGGIEGCLETIHELVERPFICPELYSRLGVEITRGILLHGPPGCGKTSLAQAIANEIGVPMLRISAPEVISGMSGETEAKIRDLFAEAKKLAPCIVFIDEIDAIALKRESAQREMERRIVAQLSTCMDELTLEQTGGNPVIVIGATNRLDALDPAFRRAGRFDCELKLGIPNVAARNKILQIHTASMQISENFDFSAIAKRTPGFVGADLRALTRAASNIAINRVFSQLLMGKGRISLTPEQLSLISVTEEDFFQAVGKIQPSAKREGFLVGSTTTWEDIGALSSVREELFLSVVEPIRHPELFLAYGITSPAGLLLWGPPGCGKTLLAKAVANESHSNFISIKGPELLNKFVGESERSVRQVFERARASAPCIVFFDEIDALCPKRSDDSNGHSSRLVNQLLTELDGMDERKNVFVIAATNRPDILDPALLRPGRLDKLLFVDLPNPSEREEILRTMSTHLQLDHSVCIAKIAASERCDGFSGADLGALLREAGLAAIREHRLFNQKLDTKLYDRHFDAAFQNISPSVSSSDRISYNALRVHFSDGRISTAK